MDQSTYTRQNEDFRAFNEMARSFARKELLEHVHEHEYPYSREITGVMETAGKNGLFGINLPMNWGGTGLGASALAGIVEEISAIDAGMAAILFTHAAALEIIAAAAMTNEESCRSIYELAAGPEGIPLAFQSYASPEEMDFPEVSGKNKLSAERKTTFPRARRHGPICCRSWSKAEGQRLFLLSHRSVCCRRDEVRPGPHPGLPGLPGRGHQPEGCAGSADRG